MASAKIKRTKIMRIINDNAVRGRLSENYLTRKFFARNICDVKYLQFYGTLCPLCACTCRRSCYQLEGGLRVEMLWSTYQGRWPEAELRG